MCELQSSVSFEHLDKRQKLHLLYSAGGCGAPPQWLSFFSQLAFKLRGSYAKVWPLFTSDLIAVIRKSTSSDSQWVCAGWLERFDWMWNKQGLPQSTAKAIKWSLRGRPSSLWWLCDGHESAFCFWFSFSFPSASTSLVYLPVSFSMHLSVCPWLLIRLFWNQLD